MNKRGVYILVLVFGMTSNSSPALAKSFLAKCRALLTRTSSDVDANFVVPSNGMFSFKGRKGSSVLVRDLGVQNRIRVSIISPKRFLIDSTKIIHLQNKIRINDLKDTDLKNLSELTMSDAGYHPAEGYEIQLEFTPQTLEQLNAFRSFLAELHETLE